MKCYTGREKKRSSSAAIAHTKYEAPVSGVRLSGMMTSRLNGVFYISLFNGMENVRTWKQCARKEISR